MSESLIEFIGSQPIMTLLRGLSVSPKPRHLRELAARYSLSPSGVSDMLRRLGEVGVLHETREGNRRCFSLKLKPEDRVCFNPLFQNFENVLLEKRALKFSRNARKRLEWMDQAFQFYRKVKKLHRDTAQSS